MIKIQIMMRSVLMGLIILQISYTILVCSTNIHGRIILLLLN